MGKEFERWRRGDRAGRERNLSNDIYDLARQYGIDDKRVAASLYSQAYQSQLQYAPGAVWRQYEHLLREWSTPRPAPGKQTRTEAIYGSSSPWEARQPGVAPGKRTRTMALAEAIDKRERYVADREGAAAARQSDTARRKAEPFPSYNEVMAIMRELGDASGLSAEHGHQAGANAGLGGPEENVAQQSSASRAVPSAPASSEQAREQRIRQATRQADMLAAFGYVEALNAGAETPVGPALEGHRAAQAPGSDGVGAAGIGRRVGATALPAAPGSISADEPGAIIDSLAQVPASQAIQALAQAEAASPSALERQRDAAQQSLPEIPAPTGLPAQKGTAQGTAQAGTKQSQSDIASHSASHPASHSGSHPASHSASHSASGTAKETIQPEQRGAAQHAANKDLVKEAPAAEPAPTQLAGGTGATAADGAPQPDPALARSAQNALATVSIPTGQVATRAQSTPSVDLSGDANPDQLHAAFAATSQQAQYAATEAMQATGQDFGEHALVPEPDDAVLTASQELGEPKLPQAGNAAPMGLPVEAIAAVDAEVSPLLHQRIGVERQTYAQGKAHYDADSQAAHQQARQDMVGLEQSTAATQRDAQLRAQSDVSLARQDWQREIAQVQTDFQTQAGAARSEHQQQIQTRQIEGNERAMQHMAVAEREADDKKRTAASEIESKKHAAAKESGGFWGWVKSKAQALVDGLKQAVNVIYDNLRQAVKVLFKAARKLALAAIELARKAIVGLIKAYGAILKTLVNIALAAFPAMRDRFQQRIDKAITRATDIVNKAAKDLKQAVTAIIDFLASTIDKLLGLIQDLYNGLLTVIAMSISGELQALFERLGNLIDAAKTAPGQFETAAYEELLGGNLDEPLSPAELIAAGRTPPAAAQSIGTTADGSQDGALPRAPWTNDNVGVDAVVGGEQLSPELTENLFQRIGGRDGEVTFGESDEPSRSIESILAESLGAGSLPGRDETAPAPVANQTGTGPDATQNASQSVYDDGLTPRERAACKWAAMKSALLAWWSRNWYYILAGGVIGVAGFIAANILTGGAILAALPATMAAVGYLFAGVTAIQLSGHLRDFLQKSWNGDIQGGGKSLAKGLAAGAIELAMLLTFKAGSLAFKGAKGAAKGAGKGARALACGTANTVRRGAGYVVQGGRVVLRGAAQGITRGANGLRQLGARLLQRTRFNGFRIRVANSWFRIEGRINPWVTLIKGNIFVNKTRTPGAQWVSDDQLAALRTSDDPAAFLKLLQTQTILRPNAVKLMERTDLSDDLRQHIRGSLVNAAHQPRLDADGMRTVVGRMAHEPDEQQVRALLAELDRGRHVAAQMADVASGSKVFVNLKVKPGQRVDLGDGVRVDLDPLTEVDTLYRKGDTIYVEEVKHSADALRNKMRRGSQLERLLDWRERDELRRRLAFVVHTEKRWNNLLRPVQGDKDAFEVLAEKKIPLTIAGREFSVTELKKFRSLVKSKYEAMNAIKAMTMPEFYKLPDMQTIKAAMKFVGFTL